MIIGGGVEQIPAYECAIKRGFRIVGTDMNCNAPALGLADYFLIVSTKDAEGSAAAAIEFNKTHKIDELPDDQITIFIAFDENFVFYSWHKKKKNYEKKDKIIEYNELKIVTGQYSNFDVYLNTKEWLNDLSIERIPNPGSLRFIINREKGQLIRNVVWQWGGGYKDIFECKKINYFLLPKEKKEKINKKF